MGDQPLFLVCEETDASMDVEAQRRPTGSIFSMLSNDGSIVQLCRFCFHENDDIVSCITIHTFDRFQDFKGRVDSVKQPHRKDQVLFTNLVG